MLTTNNTPSTIKQLLDVYPIGTVVVNFGYKAVVIGYKADSLILRGNLSKGSVGNWIADPDKCIRVA